jgi:hypothetical protein
MKEESKFSVWHRTFNIRDGFTVEAFQFYATRITVTRSIMRRSGSLVGGV